MDVLRSISLGQEPAPRRHPWPGRDEVDAAETGDQM